MRIIAGQYKGRNLRTLPGLDIRPTSDRLRETLFNILNPRISETNFLDICAGSGTVSIEALSRGAAQVTLIEAARRAVRIIQENFQHCQIAEHDYQIIHNDALAALKQLQKTGAVFDIVYFDPPYSSHIYQPVLQYLGNNSLVAMDGLVIVEHHSKSPLSDKIGELIQFRVLRQGETTLTFYHKP